MHTCAQPPQEPELFDAGPAAPAAALLQFVGTLSAAPTIRTRAMHGQAQQVLCIDLQDVGPHGNTVHAEVPFPDRDLRAMQAQAQALQAGQRVAVTAPITSLRLSLPHAVSVAPVAD